MCTGNGGGARVMITTDQVTNLSGVPGATCTEALDDLQTQMAATIALIAGKAPANLEYVAEAADFTISATHRNKIVKVTSPTDVTVTADALAEGNMVGLVQMGAGRVIVVDGTCTVSTGASYDKATLE